LDALIFAVGAIYWFGVPFRGTITALVLSLLAFIITIVGVGLLVSSLAMTMQQGLLGSFLFIMPAVTLSGFVTPIENMPSWLQNADLLNPVRYIIIALRNTFLEGANSAMAWPQLWPLLYGRTSEKAPAAGGPQPLPLFDMPEPAGDEVPLEEQQSSVPAHSRKKSGRKPFPPELPRVEVVHDIDESEKTCQCGQELSRIGEETSEQLEIIPATVRDPPYRLLGPCPSHVHGRDQGTG
jgi:hypothetical protein